MTGIVSKLRSSRITRGIRIYALLCIVLAFSGISTGKLMINDALAECRAFAVDSSGNFCEPGQTGCSSSYFDGPSGGPYTPCTPVPEIPLAMIPLFLLVSAGSFYMVRRRILQTASF